MWTAEILEIFQYLPWAGRLSEYFLIRAVRSNEDLTVASIYTVFSGLRAYVLSSQAWPLAMFIFVLSLAPVVINYVSTYQSTDPLRGQGEKIQPFSQVALGYAIPYIDPILGCGVSNTLTDAVQQE